MAKISEAMFRKYVDGQDRITAQEYMREREVLRLAVNDAEDKYEIVNDIQNQFTEIDSEINQNRQVTENAISVVIQKAEEIEEHARDVITSVHVTKEQAQNDIVVASTQAVNEIEETKEGFLNEANALVEETKSYADDVLAGLGPYTNIAKDKEEMPALNITQFAISKNTKEVFVGNGEENMKLLDEKDRTDIVDNLKSRGFSLYEFPRIIPETDDSARIGRALTRAAGGILTIPPGLLTVSKRNVIPSDISIIGYGAEIRQTTVNTGIFDGLSIRNVFIEGLKFRGVGTDFTKASGSFARAIWINGDVLNPSKNINIRRCEFYDFSYAAISLRWVDGFDIGKNTIVGTGLSKGNINKVDNHQFGIWLGEYCSNGHVEYNDISQTAQGVFNGYDIENVKYNENYIHDIPGQHGFYISHGNIMNIHNNTVTRCALMGIKIQQAATSRTISKDISIAFNKVSDCGEHGIMSDNVDPNRTYQFYNVTIAFNEVSNCAAEGYSIASLINSKFISNKCINTQDFIATGKSRHGININHCENLEIFDFEVKNFNGNGLIVNLNNKNISIKKVKINECGQSGASNINYGVIIQEGNDITFEEIEVTDVNNKSLYSFTLVAGSNVKVRNSKFKDRDVRFFNTAAPVEWSNVEVAKTMLNYTNSAVKGLRSVSYHGTRANSPVGTEGYKNGDRYYFTDPVAGGYLGKILVGGIWKGWGMIES